MKKEKKLLLARNIFAFIVFVIFGVIIVTEKAKTILIPKAEKEMLEHVEAIYPEYQEETKQGKVSFSNKTYRMKITSKENKNWYFTVEKNKKEIKDTYQKDYLEGKTLFQYIQKELEKEIKEKTKTEVSVEILSTLDHYTESVKERIIKEENLSQLTFYIIKKEILITNWNEKEIAEAITNHIKKYDQEGITPKSYTVIITNKENITESIEISNLTVDFIDNPSKEEIIQDILEENKSKLLKDSKIKVRYLEEVE